MFISDKIANRAKGSSPDRRETQTDQDIRMAFIYLVISAAVAVFGAVYEYFSFGVYSYFMIYAFAFPLLGGVLPFIIRYFRRHRNYGSEKTDPGNTGSGMNGLQVSMWRAAIATLTIGSIMHGALEICGRPNSLTVIYLIAGMLLITGSVIIGIRNKRQLIESA